jgi:hypothetical protein
MAKAFAILLIVLGVWLGLEIFTNGTEGAFGGVFASGSPSASKEPTAQRIRNKVQRSMKAQSARTERGIGDEGAVDQVPANDDSGTDEYGSEE